MSLRKSPQLTPALQAIDDWQHRRQQEMARVTFDASQHGMLDVDISEHA